MVRGILPRCSKKSFVGSSLRSPNSWGRPVASLHPPRSLYCSSLCKNKFGFTSVYEPVWTSSLLRTFCFSKFYCADFFASFTLRQLWILKVIIPRMSRKFTGFAISWKNIKYSLTIRREREGGRGRERELTELSTVETVAILLAINSQQRWEFHVALTWILAGIFIITSLHFPDSGFYLLNGFAFYFDLFWMAWSLETNNIQSLYWVFIMFCEVYRFLFSCSRVHLGVGDPVRVKHHPEAREIFWQRLN